MHNCFSSNFNDILHEISENFNKVKFIYTIYKIYKIYTISWKEVTTLLRKTFVMNTFKICR